MILVDTNVLARGLEQGHPHHHAALASMAHLKKQSQEQLIVFPQVLTEFYSIATRSTNSLHFTPDQALAEIAEIELRFSLILETPALFSAWKKLAFKYKPTNRRAYDLRLVALMQVHAIPKILTFNDKDFQFVTEIETLNPFDLLNLSRQ